MKIGHYFSSKENTLFPNSIVSDALNNNDSKILRLHDLERAVILGSTYNLESSIEYIDSSGRKRVVVSKVIGLSEENVLLHNNKIMPIKRISKVVV